MCFAEKQNIKDMKKWQTIIEAIKKLKGNYSLYNRAAALYVSKLSSCRSAVSRELRGEQPIVFKSQ